jgi:hypothetical protein
MPSDHREKALNDFFKERHNGNLPMNPYEVFTLEFTIKVGDVYDWVTDEKRRLLSDVKTNKKAIALLEEQEKALDKVGHLLRGSIGILRVKHTEKPSYRANKCHGNFSANKLYDVKKKEKQS